MSSLRGFRCRVCRLELLARPPADRSAQSADWMPPIQCCDQSLQPLPTDQVFSTTTRGRQAVCPGCGYRVQVVVHSTGPLLCTVCHQALEIPAEALPHVHAD